MAFVRGLQGNHSRYKRVVATPKHYTGYSVEEVGGVSRTYFDSEIPMEDLSDTYLPAWEAVVTKGDVGSIMCSYNAINGRQSLVALNLECSRSATFMLAHGTLKNDVTHSRHPVLRIEGVSDQRTAREVWVQRIRGTFSV